MNPLAKPPAGLPFGRVAAALRERADPIVDEWDAVVRGAMPHLNRLTREEMRDSVPSILAGIADALGSADPGDADGVARRSARQGLSRFRLHYSVADIMHEDRLLRAVIVAQVEARLGGRMDAAEAAALHAAIDVMLRGAVAALVAEQEAQLRAAAERELKYLAFLSHDLTNNLGGVTLALKLLGRQIADCGPEAAATVGHAERSIRRTVDGMRRLLDHERLRKGDASPELRDVDLGDLADDLVRHFEPGAAAKGVTVVAEVCPGGAVARTDPELVWLVMQNLVGNAVKFSPSGAVRIRAVDRPPGAWGWAMSVSDEGPGIAPADVDRIFEAFRRGRSHGQEGVGLGLAVASQAARLLGAELSVESKVGAGATFVLSLPPRA